jgi:hypothetical protein
MKKKIFCLIILLNFSFLIVYCQRLEYYGNKIDSITIMYSSISGLSHYKNKRASKDFSEKLIIRFDDRVNKYYNSCFKTTKSIYIHETKNAVKKIKQKNFQTSKYKKN